MSARPSPAGSPAPRPPPINLEGIYANIPILINRVRNGQLNANQIPPLRNLLANHAKDIIVFHARLGKPNPLLSLPDVLNPTKKVGNNEAITTEALFLQSVAAGMNQAKNIRADPAFVTAMAAKQAALRNQQVRPPAPAPAPAAGTAAAPAPAPGAPTAAAQVQPPAPQAAGSASPAPAAASPAPNATASPASTPAATPAATPTTAQPAAPSPQPVPARPPAAPSMTVQEVRDLISLTNDARNRRFDTEPGLKQRFLSSYTFYQRRSQQNAARQAQPTASGQASPTTSAPPTPTPPTPAPPPPAPVVRQPSPPKVVPPEPEPTRRKRKLREYMKETAPHLQLELGMDDVFGDILDSLVDTATKDAIRLAAHRKSNRVELKDMAMVLEHYHDLVVDGFNVQVPKKVHVEPERKGRGVVLRRNAGAGKKDDE